MITVTDTAKQELKRILSGNADNPQASLRLVVSDQDQLGLSMDVKTPKDEVIEYEGSNLLIVEQELASSLDDITIDIEDTPEGPKLAVFREEEPEPETEKS